jgi:glycosyltransferase involved in cell wall biosynthesis
VEVAVCSSEAFTGAPAGPALRAAGLARGLAARGLDVVFVAPDGSEAPDGCSIAAFSDLGRLVEDGATLVASGFLLERHPGIANAAHLVVDAAGPFLLENLVIHEREPPARRRRILTDESAVLGRLLAHADLILCAQSRQRDLTLGMLLARASLRPELLDADPALDELLMIVPFGPTGPIEALPHAPKAGRLHLVWPGGLWEWLDPVCLVEAVAYAREQGLEVTAELWGSSSPDPLVPPQRTSELAARRTHELGLADVVELVEWVPHAERRARLARADLAVTLDHAGIEARYAFRTRLVDALALGLPTLATAGEHVADEAARRGAGFTVAPHDARAVAELLAALAANPTRLAQARAAAPAVAADWAYDRTLGPLAAWCRAPRRARAGTADEQRGGSRARIAGAWSRARSRRAT